MSARKGLGGAALGALLVACCAGLPIVLAAGAATAAWVGGLGVFAAALVGGAFLMLARGRTRTAAAAGPLVEILYFDGCPNHEPALALVQRVSDGLGVTPEIRLVNVPDAETAQRLRFLGSPTIRIDGRDVDPRTEERADYALSCRVFRTDAGIVGQPDERWVSDALLGEQRVSGGLPDGG